MNVKGKWFGIAFAFYPLFIHKLKNKTMKSFKSLALVFAAAIISLGVNAQASTTTTAKPAAKTEAKPVVKSTTKSTTEVKKTDTKKTDAKKPAPATK
jgi:hypothetical protein